MSTSALALVLDDTERQIVDGLDLVPWPIAARLARRTGSFKGRPVELTVRAYAGGPVAYARFVTIVGAGLAIGSAVAFPAGGAPIFGADLVALGPASGLIACDLSPALGPGAARDRQLALAGERLGPAPDVPPGGPLPGFCARWFSPHALFTRFDDRSAAAALAAYRRFPGAYVACALAAGPADARAACAGYARDHRDEDRTLRMLGNLFGAACAAELVDTVLFPAAPGQVASSASFQAPASG